MEGTLAPAVHLEEESHLILLRVSKILFSNTIEWDLMDPILSF